MLFKEQKYKYNQTILKVFGTDANKKIKIITMNILRTSGVEDENEKRSERGTVNSEKLINNISRTKNNIFELAYCNSWDWFFTGTLNPQKYDRTDLEKFHKNLTQWLRNYNKKYKTKIKFLFIPELHSDAQNWHMHGFIMGLPLEHLTQFKIGDKMGKGLAEKVQNGDVVYNWLAYFKKFGFCNLEQIRNHEAVSKYITKYINKNLATSVIELNAHQYYSSRGLKRAEVIKKGTMSANIAPTYENEYCKVAWLDYSDEKLEELKNSFL